jgi:peptidoglycan hydrolase FlgJ
MDACTDFEALVLSQLLKSMRASIPDGGLIPRSDGERVFQEMLDGEYAKTISRSNAMGMAAMLYAEWRDAAASPAAAPEKKLEESASTH